jgi:integrase
MKLTSKAVAALTLPPGKDDHIEFDDEMPRFGFRLRRSGSEVRKSWVCQFRRAGKSRRIKLGAAEILAAELARTAARKVLAAVDLGADPQGDKSARRSADKFTLTAFAEEFLMAKEGTVRSRTFVELKRYLQGPTYFKGLHQLPADQVTRRDIAARLLVIIRESGARTAVAARGALSELFAWGIGQGLVEHNPVIGTNRPKTSSSRNRVLSDQELVAIWIAAGDDDFGRIVRLLILLGQRRTEVGSATWDEFDLERGIWTIPSQRTKNHREHGLPLCGLVLGVINSIPRRVGRHHLFGVRGHGFCSWATAKAALDTRLGDQVRKWTLHDIRRSFATRLCDLGVAPHVVEQILNHQSGHRAGIVAVYNKSTYEREVKAALALWDDHVRSITEGGERKVIPLARVP